MGDTVYSESYTYDADDGSLSSMTPAVGSAYTFTYDALKRLSVQSNDVITKTYSYRNISDTQTTTQVSSIAYTDAGYEFTIDYTYDELGNIKTVDSTVNTSLKEAYTYDEQGQLLTESGYSGNWTYTYDTYGNIRSATDGTTTHTYTYGDSNWLDLLTAYDGHTINYDAMGNPTNWYNTKAWTGLTWQNGRQLASITDGTTNISYTYDVAGIRDSKTVGSTTYNYLTQNGQVVRQTWTDSDGSHVMDFIYDNQGRPYAVILDGTTYYYVLNLQGDVIHIFSDSGTNVATYRYDAWGRITATWSKSGHSIGELNPIRYRGYYYDKETGLYYLQSRYYDPTVKRFVNADSQLNSRLLGCAQFTYCYNNPINYLDRDGRQPEWANEIEAYIEGTKAYGWFLEETQRGSLTVFFDTFGFFRDSNGIYHAKKECWQIAFGYNAFYDFVFDIATDMQTQQTTFNYGNQSFVFWAWKGDYYNLGAGAEVGIYYGGPYHWFSGYEYSMYMAISLSYRGKTIASYYPTSTQWWVTAFNPYYQNLPASELTISYAVMFPNTTMYYAFRYSMSYSYLNWGFNDRYLIAYFVY